MYVFLQPQKNLTFLNRIPLVGPYTESQLLIYVRVIGGLSGAFSLVQSAIDKAELLCLRCSPAGPS